MMREVRTFAPAKINLTLRVHGRRADGFHELESLVAFASDCGDHVVLRGAAAGASGIVVTGAFAGEIVGPNLLSRVKGALAQALPDQVWPGIALDKALPVAAGLGGGSADAAALLRAVRGWLAETGGADQVSRIDWEGIAAALGSDVPVCLAGVPAVMRGRGEHVAPVPALAPLAIVLANPRVEVAPDKTRQVFRELDAPALGRDAAHTGDALEIERLDDPQRLVATMARVGNDLTAAATRVMPAIGEVVAALGQLPGVRLVQMAGAGPTCFAVFGTRAGADEAARLLRARHPTWWIAETTLATG